METTSPRMQHSALSSEDGFVLHNGKNNAPGLSLPPKGGQCGFYEMDSQLGYGRAWVKLGSSRVYVKHPVL